MSQAGVEYQVLEQYKPLVHSIICKTLLNTVEADQVPSAISDRVFLIFLNIKAQGHYAEYFKYLPLGNFSNADIPDLLTPVARVVCLEYLGKDKNLYRKFVQALFDAEIGKRKWSHFFYKLGCTEQQSLDLFQNAFLVLDTIVQTETPENYLIGKKPTYKGLAGFTSFLYSIGKNKWRDELKRQGRHAIAFPDDWEASDQAQDDILSALVKKEQYEQDLKLLDKLGQKCKEVLLHLVDGISLKESIMLLSSYGYAFENENALKQQRHRCRKMLSDFLPTQ